MCLPVPVQPRLSRKAKLNAFDYRAGKMGCDQNFVPETSKQPRNAASFVRRSFRRQRDRAETFLNPAQSTPLQFSGSAADRLRSTPESQLS